MINSGLIIALSILLGVVRILGMKTQWFQAVAHLWVGGLIGAWWMDRRKVLIWCVVVLSVVETACFFLLP